jgi:UDP-N-acetylmuramoylalanine--D-glutamate ligase
VAVTGTDGKTTVTTMVTDVLRAAGRRAVLAGNAEVPLVAAIADDAAELFVVEASSFGLGVSRRFAPRVATWLNLAPDHQDAHLDMAHYGAAKARIWANLGVEDVAVANADDPAVAARAAALIERGVHVQTFGRAADAGWHVADGMLCSPDGVAFVAIEDLPRAFPHDVANLLAVAATATAAGAPLEAVASVARAFRGLPHRVVLVGEAEGVRYYDDSKATAPHATLAALRGFESVVLIAGGHNKGLDLSALAAGAPHVRGVVAIGAAAAEIVAAFEGLRPVSVATSMDEAVAQARSQARPGDAVLLSPGCASFDWYGSYAERGDDFIRAVRSMVEVSS